jgi:hypothetical protein
MRDWWLKMYPPGHAPFPMEGDDPPPASESEGTGQSGGTLKRQHYDPQWLKDQELNYRRPPKGRPEAKQQPSKNESDPE